MTVTAKRQQGGQASLPGHPFLASSPPLPLVVPYPSHLLDPSSGKPPQPLSTQGDPPGLHTQLGTRRPSSSLPASRSPLGGREREALWLQARPWVRVLMEAVSSPLSQEL